MDTTILAAIIVALAAILAALIPLQYNEWRSRTLIKIRRIQSVEDRDLDQALDLYNGGPRENGGLPENERDSREDIVRWLQEVETETKEGRCELTDYFLVFKVKERVCGLLYGHYYPSSQLMFISHIVVDENVLEARQGATIALVKYLSRERRKTLKDCKGIIFELESPSSGGKEHNSACRARMRRFRTLARTQHVVVKEIKIDYLQPRLSLWENGYKEERQALMYGRTRPPHLSTMIPRAEVKKVLNFLCKNIYGDHFDTDRTKNDKYRQYLKKWYEELVTDLPEEIPVQ